MDAHHLLKEEAYIGVGRRILATSIRCCTCRPEEPATVSLGKESRMERMLKSGSMTGVKWVARAEEAGGCS